MSTIAVRCEGLGKRYEIATSARAPYGTLRESIANAASATIRRLRAPRANRRSKDSFWALRDINLEARHGEVIGVIGRNGAGKSTLLKILSRITEPTTGYADIEGRVGSMLEVGTGFHPELTGRENVYLNGAILGMSKAEVDRKFDEIVAFAEVEQFLDTQVKHYSTGMQMRLAFAVAAQLETEVLFVDEVLAVGDAQFQKKCLAKMQDVGRTGRTVFFVSHSMPSIQKLCDRGILLNAGNVEYDGPVDGAIERYLAAHISSEYSGPEDNTNAVITHATARWSEETGIMLEVSFRSPFDLVPPVLGIAIYDPVGTPVFGTNNRFEPPPNVPASMRVGSIRMQISTECLRSDTYTISLWLADHFQGYFEAMHALRIEVGSGAEQALRPPRSFIGSLKVPVRWWFSTGEGNEAEKPSLLCLGNRGL